VKVFISYSRIEASETAKTLHNYLFEYGHHEVFIDTSDIRGGDEWWNTIQNAIFGCDIFVIIVTRSALERQYIKEEVELAKKLKKRIIPCISKRYIRNVVLPLDLNKYQGIEYENLDQLIQEMGLMFESLEKYQSKQPDPTFIDKQNLEIPNQNGSNSAIDSLSKEESVSHLTAKNINEFFLKGFKPKIVIIPIIAVAIIGLIISISYFNVDYTPREPLTPVSYTIPIYHFINSWGSNGTGDGEFNFTNGISVDSSTGYVYVADKDNYRIQKFDSNGTFITKWGSNGTGDGEFNFTNGISVDSSTGYVYVADAGNNRIQKFDSNGTFITKWGTTGTGDGEFNFHHGISVDSSTGYVYVVDWDNNRIQKFDSNGTFITKWGSNGKGDGEFSYIRDIYVDSSTGYVYVAESENHRIQKFDSNGTFITKWGSNGKGDGEFGAPFGISVDSSTGYVYVADSYDRIQKFDSNGTFITKFGTKGEGDGELFYPTDLDVNSSTGYVYVADSGNNRIQVFAPAT
jgi:DNA-binding beta-propeller fold protein YncE